MNIYQLAGELMRLQAMLEAGPEDDTYDAGFVEAKMSETAEEIVAKADGYARIIRNLSALAAELENEKNRLAKRQKTAEGAVKRLKDMLQAAKDLDFMEAARLRDEMLHMQDVLDKRQ